MPDREVMEFRTAGEFRLWLKANHARSPGIWLRIFKKDGGASPLSYAEALDQALCFGWIDGQKRTYDSKSWIQRFTPRRPRSGWSKRNTQHALRLIRQGEMMPAGLARIHEAKKDGRWSKAYDSPRNAKPPADFLRLLSRIPKAAAFFATLNRANVYAIVYRLQTAKKPETRKRRLEAILQMLEAGKSFHPPKG